MKKITTVMASAALMATSFAVGALPQVPADYVGGVPMPATALPGLFAGEKGAYAVLESVMQEAEAVIYQGGCSALAGHTWDLAVSTDEFGAGFAEVSSNGSLDFHLNVVPGPSSSAPRGTSYIVTGVPGNGFGSNINLPNYRGVAAYSGRTGLPESGAMMTQAAAFTVRNVNNLFDSLTGIIIKDFYKTGATGPVPVIYNWGIQAVLKNLIPQDKWWQRSRATRSDNGVGRTVWEKNRIFAAKSLGNGRCSIRIDLEGSNDADGVFQFGTFSVRNGAPGPV